MSDEIKKSIQVKASPQETLKALQYSLSNMEGIKVFWSPNNSKVMLLTKEKSFLSAIFTRRSSYYKDAIEINIQGNVLSIETSNISPINAEKVEGIVVMVLRGISEYLSRSQAATPSN
jgi:hypothetical protein